MLLKLSKKCRAPLVNLFDEFTACVRAIKTKRFGRVHIAQKHQKVGNCTWASSKSALFALIYSIFSKRIVFSKPLAQATRQTYKYITRRCREMALETYLTDPLPSPVLLGLIKEKLQNS